MELAEIVGLTLLAVMVALVAIVMVRRVLLIRAGGFDVSWRVRPVPGDRGWMLGQARFRRGQLSLYRSFSAWPTAALTLDRSALALGAIRPPVGSESELLPPGVAIVSGSCRDMPLELALAEDALTALRSWVESRPPGSSLASRDHLGDSAGHSPRR